MPREDQDEEFEVLDLAELNHNWLQRSFTDVSKASAAKQVAVGGVTGWCAGYVFAKVGKVAATALGGSLLLLQIAQYNGYVTINWTKLERNVEKTKRQLKKDVEKQFGKLDNVAEFASQNALLAGGFTGGFLLGLASS